MNYSYPLYSPYTNVLMGKMTTHQWQLIHSIVREKQKQSLFWKNPYVALLRKYFVYLT